MKKITTIVSLATLLSGCITISLFPPLAPLQEAVLEGSGSDKILLLDISGIIAEEAREGVGDEPHRVARVKEDLLKAEKDSKVQAVILRINSPGGTVTASDAVYHEITRFRERTHKKVIAFISEIGASGAYYAAMAADRLIAAPTAITGSVGVIMLHMDVHGLLGKIGVGAEAIKSGAQKDMGSPFRELSENDRKLFQEMIDTLQARFLAVVSKGRKEIRPEQLKEIGTGRIFTAEQAKQLNLIDEIGHIDHAIDVAKQESGLKNAKIIVYRRPHQYVNNIYSIASNPLLSTWKFNPKDFLAERRVHFVYLWLP